MKAQYESDDVYGRTLQYFLNCVIQIIINFAEEEGNIQNVREWWNMHSLKKHGSDFQIMASREPLCLTLSGVSVEANWDVDIAEKVALGYCRKKVSKNVVS